MTTEKKLSTPFANQLPPLSPEELAALDASIKADGVWNPVLVDEDGNVLDGHHRLKIDPNAPRKVVEGLKTDAEKRAFVFQSNNARRNLTPKQKKEQAAGMRKVAKALRKQDPKKFTLQAVAERLGVNPSTVSRWLAPRKGTNLHVQNGSQSRPDARRKIPKGDRTKIAKRVEAGQSPRKIAKEYGVTPKAVYRIVRAEAKRRGTDAKDTQSRSESSKKSGDDGNAAQKREVAFLKKRIADYRAAMQEVAATRLKVELHQALRDDRGQDVVSLHDLYCREKKLPPPTPFDRVIVDVQAMLQILQSCDELTQKIESLVPDTIDVEKNEISARMLTKRFTEALQALEKKAEEFRGQQPQEVKPVAAE